MLEQIANAETKKDIKIILDSKGSEDDPDTIELCRNTIEKIIVVGTRLQRY